MDIKLAKLIAELAYDEGIDVKILPEYRFHQADKPTAAITIFSPIALAEMILHAPNWFIDRDGDAAYGHVALKSHFDGIKWIVF